MILVHVSVSVCSLHIHMTRISKVCVCVFNGISNYLPVFCDQPDQLPVSSPLISLLASILVLDETLIWPECQPMSGEKNEIRLECLHYSANVLM